MNDRILLIMGASSDIGISLIRQAMEEFTLVIGHYRTMNAKLVALQQAYGSQLLLLQANFAKSGEVESLISEIKGRGIAPSDIVLLPAPQFEHMRYHKISYDIFQEGMDISFRSAVLVTQAFLPEMAKKKCGHVVFMLTSGIQEPVPKHCAQYITVKFALLGLMSALASEYGPYGIALNGLSPQTVDTRFLDNQPHFILDNLIAQSQLGRMLTADEVASKICWLLSQPASQLNGQNISIP